MYLIGIDIGGTKCAVSLGKRAADGGVRLLHRCESRPTVGRAPMELLAELCADARECMARAPRRPSAAGISCGGPLDSRRGVILSPPNLVGWDEIPAAACISEALGIPARLCNDANACALAEWKLGAGRGCRSMIFLTFGTGLGAGLILDGRLYEGASDMAGEAGHIRLADCGPAGYGKSGSFEGFCSGGGIAQLAETMARERLQRGEKPPLCPSLSDLSTLTAAKVGRAAEAGDELALAIMTACGRRLGQGLSILIDLLNPERIVIGSIFARSQNELWPAARAVIERETLPAARAACEVVPAGLTESVGDLAALTVASYHLETTEGSIAE